MKAYIFPNLDKKNCMEYTLEACKVLYNNGITDFEDDLEPTEGDNIDNRKDQ